MNVRVQLFSHLRDAAGVSELDITVPEGSTVAETVAELYTARPALRAWDSSILIGVGVEFVAREYVLHPDERVALMPPVQGG